MKAGVTATWVGSAGLEITKEPARDNDCHGPSSKHRELSRIQYAQGAFNLYCVEEISCFTVCNCSGLLTVLLML